MVEYAPNSQRYEHMAFRRSGHSGLNLPCISLGLWHNFGATESIESQRALLRRAFDLGITHFDAANNYGPPPGAAETNLGKLLRDDFAPYRDELIISSKAGYPMWQGPYGDWGSRKSLLASLDQSLDRLGLDYVDIFYHHRPDPNTPLEEPMRALADAVRSGRTLYVGLSNYDADQTRQAAEFLRRERVPLVIHQPRYNLFDRKIEARLLPALAQLGIGCIAFSPLAKGILTNRYLEGFPADSRAVRSGVFLKPEHISPQILARVRALNTIATARGATLAQLACLWLLHHPELTSVLIGASKVAQIEDIHRGLSQPSLSQEELAAVDAALSEP